MAAERANMNEAAAETTFLCCFRQILKMEERFCQLLKLFCDSQLKQLLRSVIGIFCCTFSKEPQEEQSQIPWGRS